MANVLLFSKPFVGWSSICCTSSSRMAMVCRCSNGRLCKCSSSSSSSCCSSSNKSSHQLPHGVWRFQYLHHQQKPHHSKPSADGSAPTGPPAAPPAAPTAPHAATSAAPTGPAGPSDSWLRQCRLCGEDSYWREDACLNPHCKVTRYVYFSNV